MTFLFQDTIQNWKVLPTCCFLNEDADDTVELRKSPAGGEEDDDPSELVEDWAMCNTLEEGGKYTVCNRKCNSFNMFNEVVIK